MRGHTNLRNAKWEMRGMHMGNAKCASTQTSMEWPYCSFLCCEQSFTLALINDCDNMQTYLSYLMLNSLENRLAVTQQ